MPLLRPLSLSPLLQHCSKTANAATPTLTCRQCIYQDRHTHKPLASSPLLRPRPHSSATLRSFSTTRALHVAEDHYATLNLSPSASQADIKKAFYALSKAHHPDHNPHNQEEASLKFVACSDAYAILGNPAKRQAYDRSRAPASARGAAPHAQPGSYSSAQAAGGRAASGLSRRRGAFRGPPPSFYRSGGWGAGPSAEKRRANYGEGRAQHEQQKQEASSSSADDSFARQQQGGGAGARASGEQGGAADEFPFSAPNDVPHFDRSGHFRRTTSIEEQLRRGRAKRRKVLLEEQADALQEVGAGTEFRSFALIGAVIFVGVGVPVLLIGSDDSNRRRKDRG